MKWWDQMPWSLFLECWVLSQLFHSPLLPWSRGPLILLQFLPLEWYHLHIWGCWYFSRQCWLQFVLLPARLLAWCTLHMGFPGGSDGKASARNVGDLGSIPGSGRSSREGIGNPLQRSCLGCSPWGCKESDTTERLHFHSTYELNMGDSKWPWHIPFPILNQSVVPHPVLAVHCYLHTDFSGDRLGGVVFLFKNFPVCCEPRSQRL